MTTTKQGASITDDAELNAALENIYHASSAGIFHERAEFVKTIIDARIAAARKEGFREGVEKQTKEFCDKWPTQSGSTQPVELQAPAPLSNERIRKILHRYSRYMGQPGYYSDTEFDCLQDVIAFAKECRGEQAEQHSYVQEKDLVAVVNKAVNEKFGRQNALAKHLGVSASYVCDCLKGKRYMPDQILAVAGIERIVMYRFANDARAAIEAQKRK